MFTTSLPDQHHFTNSRPALAGNVVIWAHSSQPYYYPEHATPYLLMANLQGQGQYTINKQVVTTTPQRFYFLNTDDTLEICFRQQAPLQTGLLLFTDAFLQTCYHYYSTPDNTLLETPLQNSREVMIPPTPFELHHHLRAQLDLLPALHRQPEALNEVLFEIVVQCLQLSHTTQQRLQQLHVVKKSTKEELYRRLFTARELMQAGIYDTLTLEELARQVCMNKFHFLASFKALYKTTPHQYYRQLKLQKAVELLQTRQHTVTDVCRLLGFESHGSFSTLFKKQYGITPASLIIPNFE